MAEQVAAIATPKSVPLYITFAIINMTIRKDGITNVFENLFLKELPNTKKPPESPTKCRRD